MLFKSLNCTFLFEFALDMRKHIHRAEFISTCFMIERIFHSKWNSIAFKSNSVRWISISLFIASMILIHAAVNKSNIEAQKIISNIPSIRGAKWSLYWHKFMSCQSSAVGTLSIGCTAHSAGNTQCTPFGNSQLNKYQIIHKNSSTSLPTTATTTANMFIQS